MKRRASFLVAIVGGSGAGKTWLADRLQAALGRGVGRVSLDNFYRDRSQVPPERRARINFDHPRAIDWPAVDAALRDLLRGRRARVPSYDFKTHCRGPRETLLNPGAVVLMDGLWLLRRPALRRLFGVRIFIECSTAIRHRRRLARDLLSRGRNAASVRRQLRETVEPMHARFVASQKRWADVVLKGTFGRREVRRIVKCIQEVSRQ